MDTKHTKQVSRRMYFVKYVVEWNVYKTVWCERGLRMADIVTNNVTEDEINTRLVYAMLRHENLKSTCVNKGWNYTKESKEQHVLNDSTGMIWGLNSMSLKLSNEFIMTSFSLTWWKDHWKLF